MIHGFRCTTFRSCLFLTTFVSPLSFHHFRFTTFVSPLSCHHFCTTTFVPPLSCHHFRVTTFVPVCFTRCPGCVRYRNSTAIWNAYTKHLVQEGEQSMVTGRQGTVLEMIRTLESCTSYEGPKGKGGVWWCVVVCGGVWWWCLCCFGVCATCNDGYKKKLTRLCFVGALLLFLYPFPLCLQSASGKEARVGNKSRCLNWVGPRRR